MQVELIYSELENVKEFIKRMDAEGYQRDSRNGGLSHRNKKQIQINQFYGKCAELAVKNWFLKNNIPISDVDFSVSGRGEFDNGVDLTINNKISIDVKSSKFFSKFLMLEAENFQISQNQIRYVNNPNGDLPDFFIAVKVKPESDNLLNTSSVTCDIVGYLKKSRLEQAIFDPDKKFFYEREEYIPGTHTPLDAPNYIFEYSSLPNIEDILKIIK